MNFVFLNPNCPQTKNKAYTSISIEIFYRARYFFLCLLLSWTSIWIYGQEMLYLYLYPLHNSSQNIIYTSISEAFSTTLFLCIVLGLALCVPFFLYLCLCFFLPSLFPLEKKNIYFLWFWVIFFYLASLWLCSTYIIPELCSWFLKYCVSTNFLQISLQAKVSTYVFWSGKMYIFCICILQIPNLLKLLFLKNKHLYTRFLSKNRKYSIICILLLCAFVSPPDLYSQCIFFIFSVGIFEYVLWFQCLQDTVKQKKAVYKNHNIDG